MLKYLFAAAATRVAGEAMDGVARKAMWGGISAVLMLSSFVFSLMIGYWLLEPIYGPIPTAGAIAGLCFALSLAAMAVPAVADWRVRRAHAAAIARQPTVERVAESVQTETAAAVDYFGAAQVIGSAFFFGLGAARQLRGR